MEIEIRGNTPDETMHPTTNKLISGLISEVLTLIQEKAIDNAPSDLENSPVNVAINVCMGALFAIVRGRIPIDAQKEFVLEISRGLANNFKYYNEWAKTNGDKD
jgi:hypothetical protein